jgi:hypothetical protein
VVEAAGEAVLDKAGAMRLLAVTARNGRRVQRSQRDAGPQ